MIIKADNFSVTPRRFIAGTRGSYGTSTVDFVFSDEWNGLAKTISFYPAQGDPVVVVYGGESIEIPPEVMATAGIAKYIIAGTCGSNTLISVTGIIDILDTLNPAENQSEPPKPTEIQQVLTMMNAAVSTAQSVRTDADNGVFDGTDGVPAFVHIKYSPNQPVADSDLTDSPSDWMGIYSGSLPDAPTDYTLYKWYDIKGATGENGQIGPAGPSGNNGVGVPTGGTSGQILIKSDSADYATAWKTAVIIVNNTVASQWVADSTYADYAYRCDVNIPGITADMLSEVIFDCSQATSGDYAPVCMSGNGYVSVYSKVNDSITIPTIKAVNI